MLVDRLQMQLEDLGWARDRPNQHSGGADPAVHASNLSFRLEDYTVVLVDDVLYTGRTARAAIEASHVFLLAPASATAICSGTCVRRTWHTQVADRAHTAHSPALLEAAAAGRGPDGAGALACADDGRPVSGTRSPLAASRGECDWPRARACPICVSGLGVISRAGAGGALGYIARMSVSAMTVEAAPEVEEDGRVWSRAQWVCADV